MLYCKTAFAGLPLGAPQPGSACVHACVFFLMRTEETATSVWRYQPFVKQQRRHHDEQHHGADHHGGHHHRGVVGDLGNRCSDDSTKEPLMTRQHTGGVKTKTSGERKE